MSVWLDQASSAHSVEVCHRLASWRPTIKDLEGGLESLIHPLHRKNQGIVYTPNWIIDYLIENALAMSAKDKPILCDPACGSGGFLLRAAEILHRSRGLSYSESVRDCLVGWDSDSAAVDNARGLLELLSISHGESPCSEQFRLFQTDTLLGDPEQLWQLAGIEGGFDVVTTNPPYVKLQNLSPPYRKQLIDRYPRFAKGSFSLALLFLLAGHRLLADEGCLAFVTQNNFFTSLAGASVREYLQQRRCIRRIVDFGHARAFSQASAYTCLVFLGNRPSDAFQFECTSPTAEALARADFNQIRFDRLDHKKWRLAKGRHFDNLAKIEQTGVPLGELAQIRVGFATLRDNVYWTREDSGECWATDPTGERISVERGITVAAAKVAELKSEADLHQIATRIIFPYRQHHGRWQVIPEADLRRRFPNAYRHLKNCRDLLDSRDKGKANPDGWYAWGRSQGRQAPGPKLLTKTFDRRPNFMLDPSDHLFCNGYSIHLARGLPSHPHITIELLQRILNSPLMHYYAKLTSFQIEGGYQCYQKNFIERFGIPALSKQQADRLLQADPDDVRNLLADEYGVAPSDLLEITGG